MHTAKVISVNFTALHANYERLKKRIVVLRNMLEAAASPIQKKIIADQLAVAENMVREFEASPYEVEAQVDNALRNLRTRNTILAKVGNA